MLLSSPKNHVPLYKKALTQNQNCASGYTKQILMMTERILASLVN